MRRKMLIISVLLSGGLWMFHADYASSQNSKEDEALQMHNNAVKIKNPEMYQSMVDAAGGNIVNCMSCHQDIFKNKGSSGKRRPQ